MPPRIALRSSRTALPDRAGLTPAQVLVEGEQIVAIEDYLSLIHISEPTRPY